MTSPLVQSGPSKDDVKKLIKEQYKRCAIDPEYFIAKYCMIQSNDKGRCLFELYPFQKNVLVDFERHRFNIVLKGRQIGLSTLTACYSLWLMLFHKDKSILVIATKQATAKNLITKVRFANDHLPTWLKINTVEDNKLSLKFENGSEIKAETATESSGRSDRAALLILDEAAHIKNAEDIWSAALPTIGQVGKVVLLSSPNGLGGFFHKTYSEALQHLESGKTGDNLIHFNPIKLDWKVIPGRTQEWRDQQDLLQGSPQIARQEHDAEFIGSGNTVIDAEIVEWMATLVKDPIEKSGFDKNLWIWKHPDYSHQFCVVCDPARGDGGDYTAFHVLDLITNEQVAEYKGKIGTTECGHLLIEIATKYNDAIIVVERENQGWAVIQTIIDRGYDNLYYQSKDLKYIDTEAQLNQRYYSEDRKMTPGFSTSMKTRPIIIAKLQNYLNINPQTMERQVIINSIRTIEELRVFIWGDNRKGQAMDGFNDDCVMSLAICLWVRDTSMRLYQEGIDITKNAINNFRRTDVGSPIYTTGHFNQDPFKMQIGSLGTNKEILDLKEWI